MDSCRYPRLSGDVSLMPQPAYSFHSGMNAPGVVCSGSRSTSSGEIRRMSSRRQVRSSGAK